LKRIHFIILLIALIVIFSLIFGKSFLRKQFDNYKSGNQIDTWNSRITEYDLNQGRGTLSIDTTKKIPDINLDNWSYPWYMIKHTDGHFENTLGETITKKDTIKLIHNAVCFSFIKRNHIYKEPNSNLRFAESAIHNDTLRIRLFDESASNWEELSIKIKDQEFKMDYKISYVFPYKEIKYEFINQSVTINTLPPFELGQTIKGELEVEFKETIIKEEDATTYTKMITGTFEVLVE